VHQCSAIQPRDQGNGSLLVALLDADDQWYPDKIRRQGDCARIPPRSLPRLHAETVLGHLLLASAPSPGRLRYIAAPCAGKLLSRWGPEAV